MRGQGDHGGLGGMGAVIATEAVARSMEEGGTFYSTYGWHPRSVAVAIATVPYIIRHQKRLLGGVAEMSEYFRARLSQFELKQPAAVRIRGLAIGIDLGDERAAAQVQARCRREGLVVSAEGTALLLLPALNIEREVAEKGFGHLAAVHLRGKPRGKDVSWHQSHCRVRRSGTSS